MREIGWEILAVFVAIACAGSGCAQTTKDAGRIEIYVMPYYNSAGPKINVGQYSEGLNAKSEPKFVATISRMKQNWAKLSFIEMYVAAIRLYDMGYRNEATYWFYTASIVDAFLPRFSMRGKRAGLAIAGSNFLKRKSHFINWQVLISTATPLATLNVSLGLLTPCSLFALSPSLYWPTFIFGPAEL
jgi:hypothetical protein